MSKRRNVYLEGEIQVIKMAADRALEESGTIEHAVVSNLADELLKAREVLEKHKLIDEFESKFSEYEEQPK